MRGIWRKRVLFVPVLIVIAALLGFIVMHLWNWLMPQVFGLRAIGYWQALGILVLSKILFAGFPGRPGGGPWKRRMMDMWANMTPEERERFRTALRNRRGGIAPPAAETKS